MKVLYAGPLNAEGTCYSRYRALQRLGLDIIAFDTEPTLDWAQVPTTCRAFELLTLRGPRIARVNAAFQDAIEANRPEVIWIDKGFWLWPATLRRARRCGGLFVHHNTDYLHTRNWRMRWSRRLMVATADLFDVFLTTNLADFERYSRLLGVRAHLTHLGFDDERFDARPLDANAAAKWAADVVFVGHHEPRTEAGLTALADAGIKLKVYGQSRWRQSRLAERFPGMVGFPLSNEDYVAALKGARIGLCIFSNYNKNQTAGRSFEIPACGTFLLGLRSPQHLECYREGREAEFFSSHEELVSKARYYLEHDDKRQAVAARGRQRCIDSGYSWAAIMRRDWEIIVRENFSGITAKGMRSA